MIKCQQTTVNRQQTLSMKSQRTTVNGQRSTDKPELVEGGERHFDRLSDRNCQQDDKSMVPEPVEGKARHFDRLSDRNL